MIFKEIDNMKDVGDVCHYYICPCCRKEVVASDPGCPHEGKFGNNVIAHSV